MEIESAFAAVNGTHLYYEAAGAGRPVILLHGFTLDTRMWDDQFAVLAERFRTIRYDLRGFGRSELPSTEPYAHADDLGALLDFLNIERAHLVGLSKGGAVALDFAFSRPARVHSLALLDTVLRGFAWSQEGKTRDELVWQRAREGGIAAAKESWLAHPLFAPAQRQASVAQRLAQIIDDYSGWHFVHDDPERGLEPRAAERLTDLQMPLLAIVGELDLSDFRQITATIGAEAPHATQRVVLDAGHMVNMEAPEEVNRALVAHLAGS